ncbi:hypothetical protein PIB30_005266 [Stylosanthes scabra]|uniref:Uncharacterized protein n=1 Tax=Stylosanthes scabra TaxID=79078 RepID=A0ABU6T4B2_9FABA|nr:hypothetical protein [Stylosanthes scabra]
MDYVEKISTITENLQREKQILVDPLSLIRESSIVSTPTILYPPPLHPPNPKFLSLSLPNSASSSPRFAGKIPKGESHISQEQVQLRKSKSCNETRSLAMEHLHHHDDWVTFSKAEEGVKESAKSVKKKQDSDDGFGCSSLCLYLPVFGTKFLKACKIRKEEDSETKSSQRRRTVVSLEKFECGSWASGVAIVPEGIRTHSRSSYFDLPLELINGNDVNSPLEKELKGVLKNGSSRGGSARKSDGSPRHVRFSLSPALDESSCPASPAFCISPRLRKAREDFNAFLAAAQTA